MKDDIGKKDKKYIYDILKKKIAFWILFIYILFVLWGQYALMDTIFPSLPIFIFGILIAYFISKKTFGLIEHIRVEYSNEVYEKKIYTKKFFFYFVVTLIFLTLYYIARYPGIYCMDTARQLKWSIDGTYYDWHPALHTLLAYTIPYKIFGIPGIVYVQIVFFSIALAYMMAVFYRYGMKKKLRLIIYAFIMLNPMTGYMMMIAWKDSAFAILTLLLTVIVVELVYSEGEILASRWVVISVAVILAVCTLVRHNAVLFTVPMMICIISIAVKQRKKAFCVVVISLLLVLLIKGPLYRALGVYKPNQRVVETTGMCMVMMGNAYVQNSDFMSDEAVQFLEDVRNPLFWGNCYKLGDWNRVKWAEKESSLDEMDAIGASRIIGYTFDTVARCPNETLRAFLAVTGMIWKIDGDTPWDECLEYFDSNYIGNKIFQNDIEHVLIKFQPSEFGQWLKSIIDDYKSIIKNSVFKYLFYYIGIFDMILLVYALYLLSQKGCLKSIAIIMPVFAYNFGTALLLSGFDWRFFYYTFLCFFGMLFAMTKYKARGMEGE